MITINFNGNKFKFKKGQFTDLDSWYEQEYNRIEDEHIEGAIDNREHALQIHNLVETIEEIYKHL